MSVLRVFGVVCLSWSVLAAAKNPKNAAKAVPPAHGVKTPGIKIAFVQLKSEAEFPLASPPSGVLLTDSILLADSAGIHRFDAQTNKPFEPGGEIDAVQKACGGLVSAFSFVWTASCDKAAVVKLDVRPVRPPAKGKRAAAVLPADAKPAKEEAPAPPKPPAPPVWISTGAKPDARGALAASSDSIWLLGNNRTTLQRIDPLQNKVVAEIRLPAGCTSIVSAEQSLWVACPSETRVLRIDPRTNLVDKRIDVPAEPVSIAAGESSVWVLTRKEGKIARIDPKTNKVTATIELGIPNADGTLAFGEGNLWASAPGFPMMRISPETDKVVQQFHGEGGGAIHVGLGSVWLATKSGVTRYDPKRIAATLAD